MRPWGLPDGRALIVGILNVTPDSFSDGGRFLSCGLAVERGLQMADEGADIVEVGGESTRPGADAVAADEQCRRILPVVRALRDRLPRGIGIGVDTRSAAVAAAALRGGAQMVNDVSAGRDDPGMFAVVARHRAALVLCHRQGTSRTMQDRPHYDDVVHEVTEFLRARAAAALRAGVVEGAIVVDPGICFGKGREHNLSLLAHLDRIVALGHPVMLGTSRKAFMGSLMPAEPPDRRVGATCATTALGVAQGVRLFRVHDVAENRQAADVAHAINKHAM